MGGLVYSFALPRPRGGGGGSASSLFSFSTNFPATETKISEGGIWQNGTDAGTVGGDYWQDVSTDGSGAYGSGFAGATFQGSEFDDDIAHLKTSYHTFSANQYAQGTVRRAVGYNPNTNHELELLTRFTIGSHLAFGYETIIGLISGSSYISIVLWNGALSNYTPLYDPGLGSLADPVDGDVFRTEIVGNIITVYKNGSAISGASVDITAGAPPNVWNSGQPGLGFWPRSGGNVVLANLGWKDYQAGEL